MKEQLADFGLIGLAVMGQAHGVMLMAQAGWVAFTTRNEVISVRWR